MQELEKILEEIKDMLEDNKVIELNSDGTLNKCVIDVKLAWSSIKDIIRKHRNNDWIPVDERLPDECGKYLCTVECMRHRYVIVGHYNNPGWTDNYCGQKVIAWRPLQEPYRPELKTPEEMQE